MKKEETDVSHSYRLLIPFFTHSQGKPWKFLLDSPCCKDSLVTVGRWSLRTWIYVAVLIAAWTTASNGQETDRFECRPNGCCDQHEWCTFWSSIGECTSNRVWMAPNCQLACKTCPAKNRGGTKPPKKRTTPGIGSTTTSISPTPPAARIPNGSTTSTAGTISPVTNSTDVSGVVSTIGIINITDIISGIVNPSDIGIVNMPDTIGVVNDTSSIVSITDNTTESMSNLIITTTQPTPIPTPGPNLTTLAPTVETSTVTDDLSFTIELGPITTVSTTEAVITTTTTTTSPETTTSIFPDDIELVTTVTVPTTTTDTLDDIDPDTSLITSVPNTTLVAFNTTSVTVTVSSGVESESKSTAASETVFTLDTHLGGDNMTESSMTSAGKSSFMSSSEAVPTSTSTSASTTASPLTSTSTSPSTAVLSSTLAFVTTSAATSAAPSALTTLAAPSALTTLAVAPETASTSPSTIASSSTSSSTSVTSNGSVSAPTSTSATAAASASASTSSTASVSEPTSTSSSTLSSRAANVSNTTVATSTPSVLANSTEQLGVSAPGTPRSPGGPTSPDGQLNSTVSSLLGTALPPSGPQSPANSGAPAPPRVGFAPGVRLQGVIKPPKPVVPTGPKKSLGNDPNRCQELRRGNISNIIMTMIHEGLMNEREDTSAKKIFSTSDIFASNKQFGCSPQQDATDCSRNICYNLRYRSIDGTCNNFDNPLFGAAATPYIRLKPPSYDDGIALPRGTNTGIPSSRDASRFLLSSSQLVLNEKLNMLVMQFGQFVTHDITKTSLLPSDKCIGCTEIVGRCTPIKADQFDPRFGCQSPPCCLSFTRAAGVCGSGSNNPRAQLNENTAFLDGSMIYGSSTTDNNRLRDNAMMKSTAFNGHNFLPFNQQQCSGPTSCNANFDAGDNRITIFVGLAAFHTLFLREHNRIATLLQQQNPRWTADRVFQESRKIVGAELQAITYKEWLPRILGSAFRTTIGPYEGYDPMLNPAISNAFTHAGMRFGHGMIQEIYNRIDTNGQPIPEGGMKFEDGVLKPQRLLFEGGVDPLLRGMMSTQLKKPQRVTTVVTERMFGSTDLAAINIQRGRDAGLPGYNVWREFCGLKKANTFEDLATEILDKNVRKNLETGYKTTDGIDLYVGALLEDPVVDGVVGPTVACLIGDQFKRIREGDRFWYQSPATFTPDQLAEIEKVTIARILCDNADNFQNIAPNAFEVPTGSNSFVSCSSVTSMDLTKWSE